MTLYPPDVQIILDALHDAKETLALAENGEGRIVKQALMDRGNRVAELIGQIERRGLS